MTETRSTKVIAISGGKGGVGKSSVSVNLAIGLSELNKSVMLMDADLGMANIDIMLGISPKYDLYDVIKGERTLEEVIVDGPGGIRIIPASSGVGHMANLSVAEQAGLIRAFGELDESVDVFVVDTAAGISNSVINFSKAVHEVIVVVCDEPASITDAYALIKVLNLEHGISRFQVLANMVKDMEQGKALCSKLIRAADVYLDVSIGYMGSIPYDENLKKAVRKQSAVMESFPYSISSIAFQQLAKRVIDLPITPTTTGYLEFFVEKLVNTESTMAGHLNG